MPVIRANDASRRSCLYAGTVMHQRLTPRRHAFRHGLFVAYLDLDELDALDRDLRWFSRNRRNLFEFRDSDHLPPPAGRPNAGAREAVVAWLAGNGIPIPAEARIGLLTLPRVAGYVFNPVSFYFVHHPDGSRIAAVAEVGNTFGELKPYLVPPETRGDGFRQVVPKHFYVSPFSGLDLRFDFRLRTPDGRLDLRVNDVGEDGEPVLLSHLEGERLPLTDATLLRMTARYPLVTLRVITLIHWHALRLWLKRIPWHPKAARPELQRDHFRRDPTRPAAVATVPASPDSL